MSLFVHVVIGCLADIREQQFHLLVSAVFGKSPVQLVRGLIMVLQGEVGQPSKPWYGTCTLVTGSSHINLTIPKATSTKCT